MSAHTSSFIGGVWIALETCACAGARSAGTPPTRRKNGRRLESGSEIETCLRCSLPHEFFDFTDEQHVA